MNQKIIVVGGLAALFLWFLFGRKASAAEVATGYAAPASSSAGGPVSSALAPVSTPGPFATALTEFFSQPSADDIQSDSVTAPEQVSAAPTSNPDKSAPLIFVPNKGPDVAPLAGGSASAPPQPVAVAPTTGLVEATAEQQAQALEEFRSAYAQYYGAPDSVGFSQYYAGF